MVVMLQVGLGGIVMEVEGEGEGCGHGGGGDFNKVLHNNPLKISMRHTQVSLSLMFTETKTLNMDDHEKSQIASFYGNTIYSGSPSVDCGSD